MASQRLGWQTDKRRLEEVKALFLEGVQDRAIMTQAMAQRVMDELLDTRRFRQMDQAILGKIGQKL